MPLAFPVEPVACASTLALGAAAVLAMSGALVGTAAVAGAVGASGAQTRAAVLSNTVGQAGAIALLVALFTWTFAFPAAVFVAVTSGVLMGRALLEKAETRKSSTR